LEELGVREPVEESWVIVRPGASEPMRRRKLLVRKEIVDPPLARRACCGMAETPT